MHLLLTSTITPNTVILIDIEDQPVIVSQTAMPKRQRTLPKMLSRPPGCHLVHPKQQLQIPLRKLLLYSLQIHQRMVHLIEPQLIDHLHSQSNHLIVQPQLLIESLISQLRPFHPFLSRHMVPTKRKQGRNNTDQLQHPPYHHKMLLVLLRIWIGYYSLLYGRHEYLGNYILEEVQS
jgi:hypothetical protein